MTDYFNGQPTRDIGELEPYTGLRAKDRIVGRLRQDAYLTNYEHMKLNYRGGVEFQLREQAVILCPQTTDVLYHQYTPTQVSQRLEPRPILDDVAGRIAGNLPDNRSRALALMRFCRDLYKQDPAKVMPDDFHNNDYIFGGTEEQLIEKGEELCECLARLFVALCERIGIAARIVLHAIGGHLTNEAYIEEAWAYIDPRCGMYFVKPDAQLAPVWELWQNPSLLGGQTEQVRADCTDRWPYEVRLQKCQQRYFHPKEVNTIVNYSLADSPRYDYHQTTIQDACDAGFWPSCERYHSLTRRVFELGDESTQASIGNVPCARFP